MWQKAWGSPLSCHAPHSQESVDKAVETVSGQLPPGGLQAVINNAGCLVVGVTDMADVGDLDRVLQVNAIGLARVTRACLPLLRNSKGRVINTASVAGRMAFPGIPYYSASKFAVEGFTDSLRREMMPWGVKVCRGMMGGDIAWGYFEGERKREERRASHFSAEIRYFPR